MPSAPRSQRASFSDGSLYASKAKPAADTAVAMLKSALAASIMRIGRDVSAGTGRKPKGATPTETAVVYPNKCTSSVPRTIGLARSVARWSGKGAADAASDGCSVRSRPNA